LQRIFFLTSFFVKQTNPAPGAVQQHLICLCVEKLKLLADQHPGGGAGGQPWGPWLPTPSSPWLLILPDKAAALQPGEVIKITANIFKRVLRTVLEGSHWWSG
jgi:hypothetical protein